MMHILAMAWTSRYVSKIIFGLVVAYFSMSIIWKSGRTWLNFYLNEKKYMGFLITVTSSLWII